MKELNKFVYVLLRKWQLRGVDKKILWKAKRAVRELQQEIKRQVPAGFLFLYRARSPVHVGNAWPEANLWHLWLEYESEPIVTMTGTWWRRNVGVITSHHTHSDFPHLPQAISFILWRKNMPNRIIQTHSLVMPHGRE